MTFTTMNALFWIGVSAFHVEFQLMLMNEATNYPAGFTLQKD